MESERLKVMDNDEIINLMDECSEETHEVCPHCVGLLLKEASLRMYVLMQQQIKLSH